MPPARNHTVRAMPAPAMTARDRADPLSSQLSRGTGGAFAAAVAGAIEGGPVVEATLAGCDCQRVAHLLWTSPAKIALHGARGKGCPLTIRAPFPLEREPGLNSRYSEYLEGAPDYRWLRSLAALAV